MLKKFLCIAILGTFILSFTAYAADFSSSAEIVNGGSKKYKAVKLVPPLYNNTNSNLSDIMLYDENNEPVPYFINSYTETSSKTNASFPMKLIKSFTVSDVASDEANSIDMKYKHSFADYALVTPQENDVLATSIEVTANNTGFAKNVELFGSYDGNSWESVQNDILYDVDGNKKLEIPFLGVKEYTYYRFKILNNLENISFNAVTLNYNNIVKNKENYTASIFPQYSAQTVDKTTVIKIKGLKNLKVESITIKTDSMFKRAVSFEGVASKTLYNLNFKDTQYNDTVLPLNSYKVKEAEAELIIQNGDDKPININEIQVNFLLDELIFDGSNGDKFTLKFGNSKVTTPPSYDIANYKDEIIREGYDVLDMGEIKVQQQNQEQAEPTQDFSWIFNIVISVVAVIMGVVIVLKLKKVDR